jgi:hypothetical protein
VQKEGETPILFASVYREGQGECTSTQEFWRIKSVQSLVQDQ